MSEKPKVRTEQVGDKTIPILVWPDGSHIHLMPYKIDGGQDPAEQLQRWVEAWQDVWKEKYLAAMESHGFTREFVLNENTPK